MRLARIIVAVALALCVASPTVARADAWEGSVRYRTNPKTCQAQVVGTKGKSVRIPAKVRVGGKAYKVVSVSVPRLGRDLRTVRLEANVRNRELRRYHIVTPQARIYDWYHNCGGRYPARVELVR